MLFFPTLHFTKTNWRASMKSAISHYTAQIWVLKTCFLRLINCLPMMAALSYYFLIIGGKFLKNSHRRRRISNSVDQKHPTFRDARCRCALRAIDANQHSGRARSPDATRDIIHSPTITVSLDPHESKIFTGNIDRRRQRDSRQLRCAM